MFVGKSLLDIFRHETVAKFSFWSTSFVA